MEQPGESRLESFLLDSAERGRHAPRRWRRVLLAVLVLLVLLGIWWSCEPERPQLTQLPGIAGKRVVAPGVATTAMLEATVAQLLDKSGGYLGNDALPPGVWLDNMPAFERGALVAARDLVRAMRRDFSHAAGVSLEDPDLLRAEPRLFFDDNRWLSTEGEYREGLLALASYRERLASAGPGAHFHPRADALARWLADVDARLEYYGARLAAGSGDGESAAAWTDIDDLFYEARGYAWALRAQQDAITVDFAGVLAPHAELQRAALRDLDGTQRPVRSPFILSGGEYGLLANHALVMAGHLALARSHLQQLRLRLVGG